MGPSRKFRAAVARAVLITATSVSAYLSFGIKRDFLPGFALDETSPYRISAREEETYFRGDAGLVAFVHAAGLDPAARVSAAEGIAESIRTGTGYSVTGPADFPVPSAGGELEWKRVADRPAEEAGTLLSMLLAGNPLFFRLFALKDPGDLALYISIQDKDVPIASDAVRRSIPAAFRESTVIWGEPYFRKILADRTDRDLSVLLAFAAAAILIALFMVARDLPLALLLWVASLVPAIVALAAFPVLRWDFRTESILVPVEVLALSTSYAIQVFRHAGLHESERASDGIAGIVLLCGLTTLAGFATLLVSDLSGIRRIGFVIVIGIAAAMAVALLWLSSVLDLAKPNRPFKTKPSRILGNNSGKPLPAAIATTIIVLLSVGLFRVAGRADPLDLLRGSDPYTKERASGIRQFGGMDSLGVLVDTGTEFGLTEEKAFQNIRALSREIEKLPHVSAAISYTDFVEEGFAALAPDRGIPDDQAEIGETLELLASRSDGFDIGSLVDVSYRRAKILVRYDGSQGFAGLRTAIAERCLGATGGLRTAIVGYQEEAFLINEAIRNGLGRGSLLFIPFLFALLAAVFKSVRWGAVCMLPSIAAIIAYLGAAGWLGIPLDAVTATGIAAVMGVGVDDAIHLLATARSLMAANDGGEDPFARAAALAGSSIVQTTLTIFAGLAALFFSAYASVASAGFLSIIALGIGTLTTVTVVPWLGRRFLMTAPDSSAL